MAKSARVLALIAVCALYTQSATATYRCDPNAPLIAATCTVANVTLLTPAEIANASFPDDVRYVALAIVDGFIPTFTRDLARKFPKVQDLTVDALGIQRLYVGSNWEQLSARNNSIREVEFAAVQHRLRSLRLDDNRLSKVPSFGRWFNELKLLSLDGNRLEQIALDAFAELEYLQSLSLARNGLIIVEPTVRVPNRAVRGVQLLKLKHLSLASNRLITVNISDWEMPSLVSLDLSSNDLYMLLDEPSQLRQLGALLNVSYAGNDWNCGWLSEAQLVLRERGIVTLTQDTAGRCEARQMKSLNGVCCYDRAFEQDLKQDPFESKWEQLNELRRRYELVQFAYDQVEDNDLNLITRQAHALRGQLVGPVAHEQDAITSELLRLRHALADESARLERLQHGIERTVHDLGQSIDELHERAVRPKPTLDAVHQQTVSDSIRRIQTHIELLRRRVQRYVYETSDRERRLRRQSEQIKQLEDKLRELKQLEQSLSEQVNYLEPRVHNAHRMVEDMLQSNSDEEFDRIRTYDRRHYRASYRTIG
ncbi:uncharacterized protein LOC118512982 [Anopheles stephensi]|uniref:uncharacterized protein LOC118512982 n=1 Tax=Anopheles stephensi TaxID=30069 RepID=UPI001658BE45|nr:uncharacterized protein LOC118512982 [Anopheles stephensi]